MRSFTIILLLSFLGFTGCKSVTDVNTASTIRDTTSAETLKRIFRPIFFTYSNDSVLVASILKQENKLIHKDSSGNYYDARIFYSKNAPFKVLNLYGEVTGGATYNPFSKSYVVMNNKITDTVFNGEIFRIDRVSDCFILYFDDYWRLGRNIHVYEAKLTLDTLNAKRTSKHGNYLFDLIRNKKESPEMFPNEFDFSRRYTENEVNVLSLDTTQLDENDYYFLGKDPFLIKDVDKVDFQIYYTHKYGDELTKMLRIKRQDSVEDVLLARNGGDHDSYETSTEFVNDSIFVETEVTTETMKDETSVMSYKHDSIIKIFSYDKQFHFSEISRNSIRIYDEYSLVGREWKKQKRVLKGRPFNLNGRVVSWQYHLEYSYVHDGSLSTHVNFAKELLDTVSKQIILKDMADVVRTSSIDFAETDEKFTYIEFDGIRDYRSRSNTSSGSAGEFSNVFLYNPKKREFEFSEMLSGYNFTVDEKNRTITTIAKSGYGQYFVGVLHFGKRSELLYSEAYTSKSRSSDNKMVLTYAKSKNGKVISEKTKVLDPDAIENEDILGLLMGIGE